ncbi:MAG: 3'-5' exonuclease [Bradymonadia bacterium]
MSDLNPEEQTIINEEVEILGRVRTQMIDHVMANVPRVNYDEELVRLRDQIGEERAEDHAMLVEHMTRLASLRSIRGKGTSLPPDPQNPYFAHLRLREGEQVRDVLIGRRSFIDTGNAIHVVDWRNSPISRIYYRYEEGDEYEESFAGRLKNGVVELRRTVTIAEGELVRVRAGEEVLVFRGGEWQRMSADQRQLSGGAGAAIRAPSERLGRSEKDQRLPEITALIDPQQFDAIAGERSGVVIIRGGAGTGKTTIALHRAAFLHFRDPQRFAPKRMLVITPGDALARYVARVLPALDVGGVPIRTFPRWAHETLKRVIPEYRKRKLTEDTPLGARRLKRHPLMLKLLAEEVQLEGRVFDALFEEAGGEIALKAWVSRRNVPTERRIKGVSRWLDGPGRKLLDVETRKRVRKVLDEAREELLDPAETWANLLTDRHRITKALTDAGESFLSWEVDQLVDTVSRQADEPIDRSDLDPHLRSGVDGRSIDEGEIQSRLDVDDLTILLRLVQLKRGRLQPPQGGAVTYEHLVVDEAQDLTPLALKVLLDAANSPDSPVTLAGDTAQKIRFDNGFDEWEQLIDDLRLRATILPPLAVSYRSTSQVMALARHVLGDLAPHEPARDARNGAPVEMFRFHETGEAVAFLADSLKSLMARERTASVALVSRTSEVADLYFNGLQRAEVPYLRRIHKQNFDFSAGIDVTDVFQIKGLEYDYIVLLEVTEEQYPNTTESRHLLHVAATRAAHQLWLLASGVPSSLLPDEMRT